MKNVKITPPDGYIIDEQKSTFSEIVFKKVDNPMDEVFKFHNIKEEDFNEKWRGFEPYEIAQAKEVLIVSYYNKNQLPDWKNSSQYKYYPYFVMDSEGFRCHYYDAHFTYSSVPTRLCFLNKADMIEATKKFLEVFKESRLG